MPHSPQSHVLEPPSEAEGSAINPPLLPLDVLDEVVDIIRRMEVLTRLMESAAESRFDLDPTTNSEAAHMVGDEIAKLRRVLQLNAEEEEQIASNR